MEDCGWAFELLDDLLVDVGEDDVVAGLDEEGSDEAASDVAGTEVDGFLVGFRHVSVRNRGEYEH